MKRALRLVANGAFATLGGAVLTVGLARAGTFAKTPVTSLNGGSTKKIALAAVNVELANKTTAINFQSLPLKDPASGKTVLATDTIKGPPVPTMHETPSPSEITG